MEEKNLQEKSRDERELKEISKKMLLDSGLALALISLIILFVFSDPKSDLIGLFAGFGASLAGYGLIMAQYSLPFEIWKGAGIAGFIMRMLFYGLIIYFVISVDANILFFILGISLPRFFLMVRGYGLKKEGDVL